MPSSKRARSQRSGRRREVPNQKPHRPLSRRRCFTPRSLVQSQTGYYDSAAPHSAVGGLLRCRRARYVHRVPQLQPLLLRADWELYHRRSRELGRRVQLSHSRPDRKPAISEGETGRTRRARPAAGIERLYTRARRQRNQITQISITRPGKTIGIASPLPRRLNPKWTDEADQNQIDGHDVIEKTRNKQNQDSREQRNDRGEGSEPERDRATPGLGKCRLRENRLNREKQK
jgi:hypothetical protein